MIIMCGRYYLTNTNAIKKMYNLDLTPRYNIAPSQEVLTFTDKHIMRKWSYSPLWAKSPMNLINARSETLDQKPSFRQAKRCIIIADGWYEWKSNESSKIPYYHHLNGEIFHFAGLYNTEGCLIVTRKSSHNLSFVHYRMPVLLDNNEINNWLNGANIFSSNLSNSIQAYPVSKYVNNTKNDDYRCFKKI